MKRPKPERPEAAPPALPPEIIISRRRRRVFAAVTFGLAVLALLWKFSADPIPEARGQTGIPLPGLATEDSDRALATAPASVFEDLSWDLLGEVGTDPLNPVAPPDLQALAGRPVTIAGFMVPLEADKRTLDFVIVPDMARCWFCEAPDPGRSIYCRAAFGPIEAEYDRPVRISGVLDVAPLFDGDVLHSLVRLRAVRVERL